MHPESSSWQVKFHVISHQKLLNGDSSSNASSMHHLNMQQLSKALITLLNLYEVNRINGAIFENEAEFHSFYVLLHLGSNSQATVCLQLTESIDNFWVNTVQSTLSPMSNTLLARICQGESLTLWFRTLRSPVIKSKEMCFARRILRYFSCFLRFVCFLCFNKAWWCLERSFFSHLTNFTFFFPLFYLPLLFIWTDIFGCVIIRVSFVP